MKTLTCAIVAAGGLLVADTTTAEITSTTGGGGGLDCTGATLSQGVIWPPDHKMVAETIMGVTTDPYLTLTISIVGIYQDEPVNTLGSGNTAPDGMIVSATSTTPSTAYVRAERAGPGTGRIYFITFTATDGVSTCSPTTPLQAIVPHDQGQGYAPIDTGVKYDSTVVPP